MKPERQQVKIAEACGWDRFCTHDVNGKTVNYGHPPKDKSRYERPLEDYLQDLNACHEMEKVVWESGLWREYADCLAQWCRGYIGSIHATASQRAEAFLRTKGLWEEEP